MSYLSHSGANVPGSESTRERKFQGAKVPGSESSTYGTFALGSESTWERKFQLPYECIVRSLKVSCYTIYMHHVILAID